jgi:ABC-type polysaccharide/polyol phosphate export permease
MTNALQRLPLLGFVKEALSHRSVIYAMALHDFRSRYVGTLGGAIWAFAQPLAIVTIYYFVFAIGFRVQGPENVPFILWFVGGLVPWFVVNETLMAITGSVTGNAHLVKRTIFPTEVLSIVHIASGVIPHMIFLCLLVGLMFFFNVPFRLERLLVLYYFVCIVVLLLGLGWLFSALQVFYRDIGQALAILLNIWFWATPIVWPENIIPEAYHWVMFYNPMYYIVSGYRDALIYTEVAWPDGLQTAYFWVFAAIVLLLGTYVFRRLKPEFADVI